MQSIFDIRVQKLFVIACGLKIAFAYLGWQLNFTWSLGFAAPLLVMAAYIVLGIYRRDNDVTDEKFADTCYYLGFIFTITSIIFSLLDLPNIGTKIQEIAVRFGAAMVSTVLGLAVRVYLVSFKKDMADAIKDAEDAVLDATRRFTEQLTIALERLRDFESQVDTAAKASVERVNLQVENLSKNHADRLTTFFTDLTAKNQEAFSVSLGEVKSASQKLAQSVDGYSIGMRANLTSIEAKVTAFAEAITDRLKTTTFPDDYFAQQLSSPISQLRESSTSLASGIKDSLQEVTDSTKILSAALKKIRDKAGAAEDSLETVLKLTQQQQAVLDAAQGQVSSLEQLGNTLKKVDETLTSAVAGVVSSNGLTSELTARVGGIVADGAETRKTVEAALKGVAETLKAQVEATGSVATRLDASATTNRELAHRLATKLEASTAAAETASTALSAATAASSAVSGKLDTVAAADLKAVQALDALGVQANAALSRVDSAVAQLQGMVRQLAALDSTLRTRSPGGSLLEPRAQTVAGSGLTAATVTGGTAASNALPAFGQPHAAPPAAGQALHAGSTHGVLPTGQVAAPAGARPSPPSPGPAGPGAAQASAPRNGDGHALPGSSGMAAGSAPVSPQIQVPTPVSRPPEQGAGSTPPAQQQPPAP